MPSGELVCGAAGPLASELADGSGEVAPLDARQFGFT
jgi:hypothetical protein